jgi:hypothetical protein
MWMRCEGMRYDSTELSVTYHVVAEIKRYLFLLVLAFACCIKQVVFALL